MLTANTLKLWSRTVKVFLAEGNQDYEKDGMATDRDGLQASVGARRGLCGLRAPAVRKPGGGPITTTAATTTFTITPSTSNTTTD